MTKNKKGFTLIELLVVVLIIGVLAAIALPMYQKAVLKSRFAALMPIAKAMADSNEAYYLEHTQYASNPQDLPVQGQLEYPTGTEIELAPGLEYAYVMASNPAARNNYIVYQKHSTKFADNIHCEALEDDEQANGVCISLGGTPINGSLTEGYNTYVLSGTYGETDKLPTSIHKLAKTICANVSEKNCSVDEGNNTITTKQCGTNISYNYLGSPATGTGCINTIYDDAGNRIGQTATVCYFSQNSTFTNDTCVPSRGGGVGAYELTFDENGQKIGGKNCTSYNYTDRGCQQVDEYVYENGSQQETYHRTMRCSTGVIDSVTLACPDGFDSGTEWRYDPQLREETEYRKCTAANPTTGVCTQYDSAGSYDTTYGPNHVKNSYNDYTQSVCTQWNGTECNEGNWVIKQKWVGNSRGYCSGGAVTGPNTCEGYGWWLETDNYHGYCANGIDWDTMTCKSGTSI